MPLTYNEFITSFSEFATVDPNKVIQTIDQVVVETCEYDNLANVPAQSLATKLHVAHYLTLCLQAENSFNKGTGQKVKKLKSKQDEIEFGFDANDPYGFKSTQYGVRLERLLESNQIGLNINWCC